MKEKCTLFTFLISTLTFVFLLRVTKVHSLEPANDYWRSMDASLSVAVVSGVLILIAIGVLLRSLRMRRVMNRKTEELLRSENRFHSIVENSHDGIIIMDDSYRFIYANEEFCKILGYKMKEIIGNDFRNFIHTESLAMVEDRYQRRLRGEDVSDKYEFDIIKKGGETRRVTMSIARIADTNDRMQTMAQILDITPAIESEKELKRSEENYRRLYRESRKTEQLYRSLMDSSADAVIIYDLEGRVTYINPAFTAIFGWTLDELEGKQIPFVPDSEKEITTTIIKSILHEGKPCQGFETMRNTKEGRPLDVSISAARYDDYNGRPAGILVTIRDITHTRKLQAQLHHAQRLESIGMISSGVAHNFRNILAGISVNNQLIQMKNRDNRPLLEIVDRVESTIKRGSQLVDELMQFSRKQSREKHKKLELGSLLTQTCNLISKSFDKKIEIEIDVSEPLWVVGDHSSLSQVVMNLATNARDAMPGGGQLRIAAWRREDNAEIVVSDTGHGMDKDTTSKCFDPFFTTKEVDRGTGLGLSTTYGIVKECGGDIHVYSEEGKGTIFKIYLPLCITNEHDGKYGKPAVVSGNGEKLMIVDDEMDMLKPMEEMLNSLGFRTYFARNSDEALNRYKTWAPDAVLMDRNMPGMDGNMCAKKIYDMDNNAKIIFISGYDEKGPNGVDSDIKKIIKGYITKPIDIAQLSQVLNRIL